MQRYQVQRCHRPSTITAHGSSDICCALKPTPNQTSAGPERVIRAWLAAATKVTLTFTKDLVVPMTAPGALPHVAAPLLEEASLLKMAATAPFALCSIEQPAAMLVLVTSIVATAAFDGKILATAA